MRHLEKIHHQKDQLAPTAQIRKLIRKWKDKNKVTQIGNNARAVKSQHKNKAVKGKRNPRKDQVNPECAAEVEWNVNKGRMCITHRN